MNEKSISKEYDREGVSPAESIPHLNLIEVHSGADFVKCMDCRIAESGLRPLYV